MPVLKLPVSLIPKQSLLYELTSTPGPTWLGFGGSRGGSKSGGARRVMLLRRLKRAGTKGAIYRRTYDLVRENHIDKYISEYPILADWYHKGDKEFILPNGSVIAFRYAETQKDVDAQIGKEYMDIMVDQAEAFNEKELTTLQSCCRWPETDESECKFTLTFNPGNIGHHFLQRIFFDKKYRMSDGEFHTAEQGAARIAKNPELEWMENPQDYAFIQAYGWDNVYWAVSSLIKDGYPPQCETMECGKCCSCVYYSLDSDTRFNYYIKRTQFGRQQNALPTAMRVGWLLGQMDQFAGQYYDIFSMERHVRPVLRKEWDTGWLGIDWGWDHDSVCHWFSQVDAKLTGIYREFVGGQRSAKALAQEIVDRTPESERKFIKHIFLSHDAFAKEDERDTTALQMGSVFRQYGMPQPEQATMDVGGRATLLYDMMGPRDEFTGEYKKPEIVIDPSCRKLIEVIPIVCIDSNKPLNRKEKLRPLKFEGDDAMDSCWYGLTYRMSSAKVPESVYVEEELDKITDPVAKWFARRAFEKKLKKPAVITPRTIMPWEQR